MRISIGWRELKKCVRNALGIWNEHEESYIKCGAAVVERMRISETEDWISKSMDPVVDSISPLDSV